MPLLFISTHTEHSLRSLQDPQGPQNITAQSTQLYKHISRNQDTITHQYPQGSRRVGQPAQVNTIISTSLDMLSNQSVITNKHDII